MPIDFSLLNSAGAQGGLPDFLGRVKEDQQREADRQAQFALAMQQIAAQERMAQPTQLDYARDARAAALDEIKLAREQQAMGIDYAANAREAIKAGSGLLTDEKQREAIDSGIKLDWSRFKTDTEFKQKEFDLKKELSAFDMDQARTKLGYEIKWGDNMDDREERKFRFEIDKYRQQEAQKEEMKSALQNARVQGTEALQNFFVDNGMINEFQTFVNTNEKLSQMKDTAEAKQQSKEKERIFLQLAPKIMKGEDLSDRESINLVDTLYGEDFTNKLLGTGNLKEVAKLGAISAFSKDIGELAGDPLAAAKVASSITGQKINLPQTPEDIKNKNDIIKGTFSIATRARDLEKTYNQLEEAATVFSLAGLGPAIFQSTSADVGQALSMISKSVGFEIKSGEDLDSAEEIYRGSLIGLKKQLSSQIDANGNVTAENAKLLNIMGQIDDLGPDGIKSLKEAERLEDKKAQASELQKFLDANPNASAYEIQSHMFNIGNEKDAVSLQTKSAQKQAAIEEAKRRGLI